MPLFEIISLSLLFTTVVICILSSISDIKSMTIENWHSGVIILLFIPAYFLSPNMFSPLLLHISALVIMFIISYLLFHFGVMGGGDSKLATALSLWMGLKYLLPFLLIMSITGGVLGIATIYLKKHKPFKNMPEASWIHKAQQGVNAVPYAVAITMGYIVSIFHSL